MHKIVKQFYEKNNYSIREVSQIFNISKSSIQRWITNNAIIETIKDTSVNDKISNLIIKSIKDNPFITIKHMQTKLKNQLNINISISGTYVHMKKNNFSFKKVSHKLYNNLEDTKTEIKKFRKIIKTIKLSDIVCLDESGIKENICENYGWNKKGQRVISYVKSHPKKYSLIMAINKEKIISSKIFNTNVNGKSFYEYLKNDLLPILQNKYILMDNIPFHKSKIIKDLVNGTTNKLLFIPPYCPDLNPIENVFNVIKQKLKNNTYKTNIEEIENTIKNITINFRNMYKNSFRKNYKF